MVAELETSSVFFVAFSIYNSTTMGAGTIVMYIVIAIIVIFLLMLFMGYMAYVGMAAGASGVLKTEAFHQTPHGAHGRGGGHERHM
jgi:hypothetical protein